MTEANPRAVTPATVNARAAAARMATFENIVGNGNMLRKIVYEDSVILTTLGTALTAAGAAAPMVASVSTAQRQASNAMELAGVVAVYRTGWQAAADIVAACDWLDAQP